MEDMAMTSSTKARELHNELEQARFWNKAHGPETDADYENNCLETIDKYLAAARREALNRMQSEINELKKPQAMRLRMGELSAQEARSCGALLNLLSESIRSLLPSSSDGEGL